MKNQLIIVGTGTCQVWKHRVASSVLFRVNGEGILFDIGHGVLQRLIEAGVRHDQIDHVFISHVHPDHVADIVPLVQAGTWSRDFPQKTPLHMYGTQEVIDLVKKLIDLFIDIEVGKYPIEYHTIRTGEIRIGKTVFTASHLPPANNHGLKLRFKNKTYAVTGDSDVHEQLVEFLRDVDVAIIDAGHPAADDIVKLTVAEHPKRLICSHIYKELRLPQLRRSAGSRGFRGKIEVAHDLQVIPMD